MSQANLVLVPGRSILNIKHTHTLLHISTFETKAVNLHDLCTVNTKRSILFPCVVL